MQRFAIRSALHRPDHLGRTRLRLAIPCALALALPGCGFGFIEDIFGGNERGVLSKSAAGAPSAALTAPPAVAYCMREGRVIELDEPTCKRHGGIMLRGERPGGPERPPAAQPVASVAAEPLAPAAPPAARMPLSAPPLMVPPVSPPDVAASVGRNGLKAREAMVAREAATSSSPASAGRSADPEAWAPNRVRDGSGAERPAPPAIGLMGLDPASIRSAPGTTASDPSASSRPGQGFAADVEGADTGARPLPADLPERLPSAPAGRTKQRADAPSVASNAGPAAGGSKLVEIPSFETDAPPLGAPPLRAIPFGSFENARRPQPFGGVFQSLND